MKLINYDLIILDCDGVIINSNFIKLEVFNKILSIYGKKVFEKYRVSEINKLGNDRFKKTEFFCKNILNLTNDDYEIEYMNILEKYNELLTKTLKEVEKSNLFFENNFKKLNDVIIVSAAYEKELKDIMKFHKITDYINESKIFGSPSSKIDNIQKYLNNKKINAVLIGDSYSDYTTCLELKIDFIYINKWSAELDEYKRKLKKLSKYYFEKLDDIIID